MRLIALLAPHKGSFQLLPQLSVSSSPGLSDDCSGADALNCALRLCSFNSSDDTRSCPLSPAWMLFGLASCMSCCRTNAR